MKEEKPKERCSECDNLNDDEMHGCNVCGPKFNKSLCSTCGYSGDSSCPECGGYDPYGYEHESDYLEEYE